MKGVKLSGMVRYFDPMGDYPGDFGYQASYRCECGATFCEPETHITHAATWTDPAEGYDYCPSCGNQECFSDEKRPRVFYGRRRKMKKS